MLIDKGIDRIKYYEKEGCRYDKCGVYGCAYHTVFAVSGNILVDLPDLSDKEHEKTADSAGGIDLCRTEYVWLSGGDDDDVRTEQQMGGAFAICICVAVSGIYAASD